MAAGRLDSLADALGNSREVGFTLGEQRAVRTPSAPLALCVDGRVLGAADRSGSSAVPVGDHGQGRTRVGKGLDAVDLEGFGQGSNAAPKRCPFVEGLRRRQSCDRGQHRGRGSLSCRKRL